MFIKRKEFEQYKHDVCEILDNIRADVDKVEKEIKTYKKYWANTISDIVKVEARLTELEEKLADNKEVKPRREEGNEEKILKDMATIADFSIENVINEIRKG